VNGIGIPTRDTSAMTPADSSQILIRPADSALYVRYKRAWQKVGAGGTVTGTGTINRVPKWTSSNALGNSSIVDSASSVAMTINPTGNVGIGTTNPAQKLDVNGAILSATSLYKNIAGTNVLNVAADDQQYGGSSTDGGIFVYGNNKLFLSTNSTRRLTVDGSGNVGISYTSPAARLAVNGRTLINTNTDNGVDALQVSGSAIASTLKFNTSGQTVSISSYYNGGAGLNVYIGGGGLNGTSTAGYNTALGVGSLQSITSGSINTAIGYNALNLCTSGEFNNAIGSGSLERTTSGYQNNAMGYGSLSFNTTGYFNVAVGSDALVMNTTGYKQIAIGQEAGRYISGGGNNQTSNTSIYIGTDTRASANGNSNEIVIGDATIGQGSNTVTLGNSSITKTFLRGNTMVNTTTDNGVDKLQVNGSIQGTGFNQAYLARTTTYTATTSDYFIDCTTGSFTVNLFTAVGNTGRILIIKNSGTGTITVDPNGSQTIDGATTQSLATQWSRVHIISDGANWKIISN
jgi:hypothetical protein